MHVPAIAVADTHAVIWWITDQRRRLGRRANAFFDAVDTGRAVVCIPTMVLVELDEAVVHGDVSLGGAFPDFVQQLQVTPSRYHLADLTPEIVVRAHGLFDIPERRDRLIAATAAALGYPIVTRDPEIATAVGADHVW
jgi:PIN domain nuclease of toxin-antitoxin system